MLFLKGRLPILLHVKKGFILFLCVVRESFCGTDEIPGKVRQYEHPSIFSALRPLEHLIGA